MECPLNVDRSFGLYARDAYDLRPFHRFRPEKSGELLRRAGNDVGAVAGDAFPARRRAQDSDGFPVELRYDLPRRSGGSEEAVPLHRLVARYAGFGDGGDFGRDRYTVRAG